MAQRSRDRYGQQGGGTAPSDARTTWLIAQRAAIESLRDRATLTTSAIFAVVVPFCTVLLVVRPQALQSDGKTESGLGLVIASYLLVVGLLPSSGASNVAAGLFAGEKEQGNLAPLLATPASNRAIFSGKVLGAVLPSLIYSLIALASYLLEVTLLLGPSKLRLLPGPLSITMVVLVPTYALLGAAVASLISSRARTYQGAQMVSNLLLLPIMGALFGLALLMQRWGAWLLVLAVVALLTLDVLVILISAATWRREEVMARS